LALEIPFELVSPQKWQRILSEHISGDIIKKNNIFIQIRDGISNSMAGQLIADKMKLSIIDINKIAKDSGLFEKNGDTNDVDVEALEKILESKTSENNIIVGHLAPYVLRKNQVKIMIVLRRNPYDLIPVYKDRKYDDDKISDNTGSEILGIIINDAMDKFQEKTFQINVSGKTVVEVFEKTMSIIMNKKGNETVDWLELVRKNNDLGKFFVD